jgi:predicted phage tail protein
VNPSPVSTTTYVDAPPYGTYTYRVTAVGAAGTPRIESDPSQGVAATFKDLVPPPVPANLNALIEPRRVRLVWDPVDASDLAGYKVYRTEGMGHTDIREIGTFAVGVLPPTTTTFADPGIAYKYSVTTVDKSGNESARVSTDWVVVPKTP